MVCGCAPNSSSAWRRCSTGSACTSAICSEFARIGSNRTGGQGPSAAVRAAVRVSSCSPSWKTSWITTWSSLRTASTWVSPERTSDIRSILSRLTVQAGVEHPYGQFRIRPVQALQPMLHRRVNTAADENARLSELPGDDSVHPILVLDAVRSTPGPAPADRSRCLPSPAGAGRHRRSGRSRPVRLLLPDRPCRPPVPALVCRQECRVNSRRHGDYDLPRAANRLPS